MQAPAADTQGNNQTSCQQDYTDFPRLQIFVIEARSEIFIFFQSGVL